MPPETQPNTTPASKPPPFFKFFDSLREKLGLILSDEEKADVGIHIDEQLELQRLYYLEIALAALIACFGLIQNSAAVIIGAMLIAPLLRPIQTLAFAIITGRTRLLFKSLRWLGLGSLLAVLLSWGFSLFVPTRSITSEILGRVSPNLLDLIIAASSALVAFLSLKYKRLAAGVAGVAMATALMPPLTTIGIALSLGRIGYALGASLLFFTNLIAIVGVGCVIFLLLGFSPHITEQKNVTRQLLAVGILWFLVSLPLVSALYSIAYVAKAEKIAKTEISKALETYQTGAAITDLSLIEQNRSELRYSVTLALPEGKDLTNQLFAIAQTELEDTFEKKVDFDISITRNVQIVSEKDLVARAEARAIADTKRKIEEILDENFPDFVLLQIERKESPEKFIAITLANPGTLAPSPRSRFEAEKAILRLETLDPTWRIYWNIIPTSASSSESDAAERYREELSYRISRFIDNQWPTELKVSDVAAGFNLDKMEEVSFSVNQITSYAFVISGSFAETVDIQNIKSTIETYLSEILSAPFTFELRLTPYITTSVSSLGEIEN